MARYYTPFKKGFNLQSKSAHFEKIRRRAVRGEITIHFLNGRLSFHPIPCGSRDRPVERKVIDEGKIMC